MPFTAIILARYNDRYRGPVILIDTRSIPQLPQIENMRSDAEVHDTICGSMLPIMKFDLPKRHGNENRFRVYVYNCQTHTCPHFDPTYLCEHYTKIQVNNVVSRINLLRPLSAPDGQDYYERLTRTSMYAFTHAAMLFALNLGKTTEHDLDVSINTCRIQTPEHVAFFVNFLNNNDPSGQPTPPYPRIEDFLPVEAEPISDLIFVLELEDIEINILPECCICCDPTHPPTRRLGRCGHMFHTHCIFQWAEISQTCPLCRKPVGDGDLL